MADRAIEFVLTYGPPKWEAVPVETLAGTPRRIVAYKLNTSEWTIMPMAVPLVNSENFGGLVLESAKQAVEHAKSDPPLNIPRVTGVTHSKPSDGPEAA